MAKSRIKVPKRIAGVKIPKAVRKGPVMDFVNSKAGRVLIAQALTAAIGVLAYKQTSPDTRAGVGEKIKSGAGLSSDVLKGNVMRLSSAFGEAVTAFRTALADPSMATDGESTAQDFGGEAERVEDRAGKKKRQSSSQSEPGNPH
jgi:hypothetical protein